MKKLLIAEVGNDKDFQKQSLKILLKLKEEYQNPFFTHMVTRLSSVFYLPSYIPIMHRKYNEGDYYLNCKNYLSMHYADLNFATKIKDYTQQCKKDLFHCQSIFYLINSYRFDVGNETLAGIFDEIKDSYKFYLVPCAYGMMIKNYDYEVLKDVFKKEKEIAKNTSVAEFFTHTKLGEFLQILNRIGFVTMVFSRYILSLNNLYIFSDKIEEIMNQYKLALSKNCQFSGLAKLVYEDSKTYYSYLLQKTKIEEIYHQLVEDGLKIEETKDGE